MDKGELRGEMPYNLNNYFTDDEKVKIATATGIPVKNLFPEIKNSDEVDILLESIFNRNEERHGKALDYIKWLLPMAKAWAFHNDVGNNVQICRDATGFLEDEGLL